MAQHQLEPFLAELQQTDPMDRGILWWVERDFRRHLPCGVRTYLFARLRCTDCGHGRILAFSRMGRGICSSRNARRMAEVAAQLTDEVFPRLPVRQ